MSEPFFLLGMLLLWLLLLLLLIRGAYRAYRKDKGVEAMILGAAALALIIFTGQYALLFTWLVGCEIGLLIGCRF